MGTDRPHVLRQAIHCCRNFGTVSIVGVYGGFLDKIPMGSAINRGLTFRMAQTPVQHYLPKLLERIEKGEIDPSFVITASRRARGRAGPLQDVPGQEGRLHQGRDEAVGFSCRGRAGLLRALICPSAGFDQNRVLRGRQSVRFEIIQWTRRGPKKRKRFGGASGSAEIFETVNNLWTDHRGKEDRSYAHGVP